MNPPTTHELFTKARLLNIDVLERLKASIKDGLSEDASALMEVSLHLRLCEERLEALSHAEQMRVVTGYYNDVKAKRDAGFSPPEPRSEPCTPPETEITQWKVHLPQLLVEIGKNSQCSALVIPLQILQSLLERVAERAISLNDPELNALMCRLTLYDNADPYSDNYDPELLHRTIEEGNLAYSRRIQP